MLVTRVCSTIAAALLTLACGASPSDTGGSRVVTVDGSSTVFPLSEAVAEDAQRAAPGMRVTVGISGTGGGFQKFCRGEADIGNASRPISRTEASACAQMGISYLELPVAYDGIVIVVNPRATWIDTITTAELKQLWAPEAQGTVMRWQQVRPSWPDQEIHLFGAGVDSGTYDYFTEAVMGRLKASRGDYTSSEDDNVLVQGISSDALALGFVPLAYYEENQDKLKPIAVDDERDGNGAGPIRPAPETIRAGTYQPLARPVFIYVSTQAAERAEVQRFVTYYLAHADTLAREVNFVGLGPSGYALVADRFARRTAGSLFAGAENTVGVTIDELLAKERTR